MAINESPYGKTKQIMISSSNENSAAISSVFTPIERKEKTNGLMYAFTYLKPSLCTPSHLGGQYNTIQYNTIQYKIYLYSRRYKQYNISYE